MLKKVGHSILIVFLWAGLCYAQPAGWETTPTGANHTIFFNATVQPVFNGVALENGDVIAVFYDSAGTAKCGGLAQWGGTSTSITVYGNDGINPGFAAGETFNLKIWKKNTNCVSDLVQVVFTQPDSNLITSSNQFQDGGISEISQLSATSNGLVSYSKSLYCTNETNPKPTISGISNTLTFSAPAGLSINPFTGEIDLSASTPGVYHISFNTVSCLSLSGADLSIAASPAKPNLGADVLLCYGTSASLGSTLLGTNTFSWSTSAQTNLINVSVAGTYWVKSTNANGCAASDTVIVSTSQIKPSNFSLNIVNGTCQLPSKIDVTSKISPIYLSAYKLYTSAGQLTSSSTSGEFEEREGKFNLIIEGTDGCLLTWPLAIGIVKPTNCDNLVLIPEDYASTNACCNLAGGNVQVKIKIPYLGLVKIFDRNGKIIRQQPSPSEWDGRDESGLLVPMGDYYVIDESGKSFTVTVLR